MRPVGEKSLKTLARVHAVEHASKEKALNWALQNERDAQTELEHARRERMEAAESVERAKEALLEQVTRSADDLARRAQDLEQHRTKLGRATERTEAAANKLKDAQAESKMRRLAWANSKSSEKALERKLVEAEKQDRAQRESREDD